MIDYAASPGSRSPLYLVGAAVAVRVIANARASSRPVRAIVLVAFLGYAAIVFAIGASNWRSNVVHHRPASVARQLESAAQNPFNKLTDRTQIDTFEGLILSLQVDRKAVGAHWDDPLKAVVNFMPRSIWPSKPAWLGTVVTHAYLNSGGTSGVFLSGPGYAYIVYGGIIGVIGVFLVLGATAQLLYTRFDPYSGGSLLLTYFCLRFFVAGDAFDLFNVLGLAVLLFAARQAAQVIRRLLPQRGAAHGVGVHAAP